MHFQLDSMKAVLYQIVELIYLNLGTEINAPYDILSSNGNARINVSATKHRR